MIQIQACLVSINDLSNPYQNLSLVEPDTTSTVPSTCIEIPQSIHPELYMKNKVLISKAPAKILLNLEKSSYGGILNKYKHYYEMPKDKKLNIIFSLVNENSRNFSKYYFLRDGRGYYFVSDIAVPNNYEVKSLLSSHHPFTVSMPYWEEQGRKPIKLYSMHIDDDSVKLKKYSIFISKNVRPKDSNKFFLCLKREVTHMLWFNDENKWDIDKKLKEVIVQGVRKRYFATRHICEYYDAMS